MGEGISKLGWNNAPTKRANRVSKSSIAEQKKKYDEDMKALREKRAELTAQKRNTDNSLTAKQRDVLKEKEKSIKGLGHEEAYVVDDNGNVIYHGGGTKNRVAIPYGVQRNNVITHNHPKFAGNNNLSQDVGAALSGADVYNAIAYDAKGVRAVTSNYTFSVMRPKDGWGDLWFKAAAIESDMNDLYNKYLTQNLKRFSKLKEDSEWRGYFSKAGTQRGKIQYFFKKGDEQYIDRAAVAANAQAMREVAKKYGLNYTRGRSS